MGLEQHSEIVDAIRDVTVLTAMHTIAESANPRWRTNHVLINQLVGRALTPLDAGWASLGVGVHEVIASLMPPQEPNPAVLHRHNISSLLVARGDVWCRAILLHTARQCSRELNCEHSNRESSLYQIRLSVQELIPFCRFPNYLKLIE